MFLVPMVLLFSDIPILGSILFSRTALEFIGPKPTDKNGTVPPEKS
ncbi:hypothetical protein SUNI508_00984 [Seiridium unicorne]|uniref:Uncharacterized protein n=1 Tax=Seiridium unicorne TaxID=138068 RepID=A0ABR2V1U9_9PEZI